MIFSLFRNSIQNKKLLTNMDSSHETDLNKKNTEFPYKLKKFQTNKF